MRTALDVRSWIQEINHRAYPSHPKKEVEAPGLNIVVRLETAGFGRK